MIGKTVGQYKLIEKLGEGGMGAVYKGVDLMIEREVAIKMLRPEIARDPDLVERFRTEAITLAKLNNPGIATLYNFFRDGDDYFMVMEFVNGQTLEQRIRQSGAIPWPQAVALFSRILECIQPAHNAGILHRDLKPANIMLTQWGTVKVMDFGIARVLGAARVTREGRMVGTIEYIAPERVIGQEADIRADIYSLGVVLYEMLSGRLPFASTSDYEIMRGHVQDSPPSLTGSGIPAAIEGAVMKALAKTADKRIQNCSEFVVSLENAVRDAGGNPAEGALQTPRATAAALPFDYDDLKPTAFVDRPLPLSAATSRIHADPDLKPTQLIGTPRPVEPVEAPAPQAAKAPVPPPAAAFGWKRYVAAGIVLLALAAGGFFAFRGGPATSQAPLPPTVGSPERAAEPVSKLPALGPKKSDGLTSKTPVEPPAIPANAVAPSELGPAPPPPVPEAPAPAQSADAGLAASAEQDSVKKPSSLTKLGKGIGRGIGKVLGKKDPKKETTK